jgi:hypothetical protein
MHTHAQVHARARPSQVLPGALPLICPMSSLLSYLVQPFYHTMSNQPLVIPCQNMSEHVQAHPTNDRPFVITFLAFFGVEPKLLQSKRTQACKLAHDQLAL